MIFFNELSFFSREELMYNLVVRNTTETNSETQPLSLCLDMIKFNLQLVHSVCMSLCMSLKLEVLLLKFLNVLVLLGDLALKHLDVQYIFSSSVARLIITTLTLSYLITQMKVPTCGLEESHEF
jgi:hypothetical protein